MFVMWRSRIFAHLAARGKFICWNCFDQNFPRVACVDVEWLKQIDRMIFCFCKTHRGVVTAWIESCRICRYTNNITSKLDCSNMPGITSDFGEMIYFYFGDRQTIKPWFFRIFKESEQNFHNILHWLKGKNGNKFGKILRSSTYLKMHISRGKSDWTHAKKNKPVTEWDRRLIYLSSWCTLTESPTKSQFLISNRWKMIEKKNSPNNFIYISNVYRIEMSIT